MIAGHRCGCTAHGGKRGRKIMRASAGETRVDADGRVELRVGCAHHGGHCAAGRQPRHVDPTWVDTVAMRDFARHAGEDCRLALVSTLVAALEPVPAPRTIGSMRLLGIENEALPLLGERVHAGAVRKVIGCLRATVQHDDEREPLFGVTRRDIELVGTCSGLIGIRPRHELARLPVNHCRLRTRHPRCGVASAPFTRKALEAEAFRYAVVRRRLQWSRTAVRGLRDLDVLDVDNVVTRAAVVVRRLAVGTLGGRRAVPKDALNERSGFEQTARARQLRRCEEAGGYSFGRSHDVPSQAWIDSYRIRSARAAFTLGLARRAPKITMEAMVCAASCAGTSSSIVARPSTRMCSCSPAARTDSR